MIKEGTGCGNLLAARGDRCCTGLLHNLVEEALHTPEMNWSFGLGWGDGWSGLCNGGRGHQGDEHEFRFHGWSYLGWVGWI